MGFSSSGLLAAGIHRYTVWLKWDKAAKKVAGWNDANVVGEELYDHAGDDGMSTDKFENVNVAKTNLDICTSMKSALIAGWRRALPQKQRV